MREWNKFANRIIRFDEQVVASTDINTLSPELCERFATSQSDSDRNVLLTKLGMLRVDEQGFARPTVAGLLMGSTHPQRWMTNAFIQAVAYRGIEIDTRRASGPYQLDAADITGSLDQQILSACHFVRKNSRTMAVKNVGRLDIPQFDHRAVFEAIVNAVAHRDYSDSGAKIRLRLFEDRLEIYSPGMLANSMTVDSLRYRQTARNETLCSLLARCSLGDEMQTSVGRVYFMEKRGEGVPIILDNSMALAGREPEYRLLDDSELLLTIFAASDEASDEAHQS